MHNSRTGGGKSKLESATIGKTLSLSSVISGYECRLVSISEMSAGPELLGVLCSAEHRQIVQ